MKIYQKISEMLTKKRKNCFLDGFVFLPAWNLYSGIGDYNKALSKLLEPTPNNLFKSFCYQTGMLLSLPVACFTSIADSITNFNVNVGEEYKKATIKYHGLESLFPTSL